jgi:hypothetical protein
MNFFIAILPFHSLLIEIEARSSICREPRQFFTSTLTHPGMNAAAIQMFAFETLVICNRLPCKIRVFGYREIGKAIGTF